MAEEITKEMSIIEIIQKYTKEGELFVKYGLENKGCTAARFENLEAGARVHGVDPDEMVAEINALL